MAFHFHSFCIRIVVANIYYAHDMVNMRKKSRFWEMEMERDHMHCIWVGIGKTNNGIGFEFT